MLTDNQLAMLAAITKAQNDAIMYGTGFIKITEDSWARVDPMQVMIRMELEGELSSDRDRRRVLLMRMRDALAKPGAWCKGVDLNRNCLVTAARSMGRPQEADAVISLLADRIRHERPWSAWAYILPAQYCVIAYNDAPSRVQADVVALLDRTIEGM